MYEQLQYFNVETPALFLALFLKKSKVQSMLPLDKPWSDWVECFMFKI